MKILLIEDEISKERRIVSHLKETFQAVEIVTKHSIMSSELEMQKQSYDFVLLDMSLPLFDNDDTDMRRNENNEFDTFGGLTILDEMDRRNLSSKVIVITAFDILGEGRNQIDLQSIDAQMRIDYEGMVIGTIFYNSSSLQWREKLTTLISKNWSD